MKVYNKLVRDRIPDIIRADGHIPQCETLDTARYLDALELKLLEEAAEYRQTPCMEEMADLMGQPITWAPGLPLRADGYETPFYKKD